MPADMGRVTVTLKGVHGMTPAPQRVFVKAYWFLVYCVAVGMVGGLFVVSVR